MTLLDELGSDFAPSLEGPKPEPQCGWCLRPIPAGKRADSIYCGTPCRQASHRFGKGRRRRAEVGRAMTFAYADPPYVGKAKRCYEGHRDYAGEVDHRRLVAELADRFPDGWALSCSSSSLQQLLGYCSDLGLVVSVRAWFRGERPAAHLEPLSGWEPVIVAGGRPYLCGPEPDVRRVDALVYHSRPRRSDVGRVTGAKPAEFAWWLFDQLGALPHDHLEDLFPGSGGIARAWELYRQEGPS